MISLCSCTYIGPGIYHNVSKGETIWDIASSYNVDSDRILKANRKLKNPDRITAGQRIYVPGARTVKKVVKSNFDFIWPVRGKIVQKFGKYNRKRYLGILIEAKEGVSVHAAEAGKVVFVSEEFRSYGKTIIVEHNKNYTTVYAHNRLNSVRENEFVKKGQKIGEVGRTGRIDNPGLYFEIRYKEKPRNPVLILP